MPRFGSGSTRGRIAGIIALVLFGLAMLAVTVALTFSVQVHGNSMNPTLVPGDRLSVDFLSRDDIERFDLVNVVLRPGAPAIVKRVIGLPGDVVSIEGGENPVVYLKPSGESQRYVVTNPSWPDQINGSFQGCCEDGGNSTDDSDPREVTIGEDQYWVIGDNWGGSDDSRTFGFVDAGDIQAKLNFRLLPWDRYGRVPSDGIALVRAD